MKGAKFMRASNETYEKVAKRCSSYNPTRTGAKNIINSSEDVSCLNCEHFDAEKYCKIDLYDKIVSSYNL